jgi:NADH-quinone oxidoreductase subunit C
VPAATVILSGHDVAQRLSSVTDSIVSAFDGFVELRPERLLDACRFLRDDRATDGRFLNSVSGVDRYEWFEVVYNVTSLSHNHTFELKIRADHDQPEVPSVASIWHGAHLQEREIYDLLGIRFTGHPDLKRLFLWDGFPGHPLRKDFTSLPGGQHPGLQRFPKEDPRGWAGEFRGD